MATVGFEDVTEHPAGYSAFRIGPWQDGESAGVGFGDHVRLLNACKPLYRRAIETHAFLQRFLQFVNRYDEILQESQYVCEPQTDKLHLFLVGPLQDLCCFTASHTASSHEWNYGRSPLAPT